MGRKLISSVYTQVENKLIILVEELPVGYYSVCISNNTKEIRIARAIKSKI